MQILNEQRLSKGEVVKEKKEDTKFDYDDNQHIGVLTVLYCFYCYDIERFFQLRTKKQKSVTITYLLLIMNILLITITGVLSFLLQFVSVAYLIYLLVEYRTVDICIVNLKFEVYVAWLIAFLYLCVYQYKFYVKSQNLHMRSTFRCECRVIAYVDLLVEYSKLGFRSYSRVPWSRLSTALRIHTWSVLLLRPIECFSWT